MKKSKSTGIRPEQIVIGAKLRIKRNINSNRCPFDQIDQEFLGKVVTVNEIDDPITDSIPYDVYCKSVADFSYVGLKDFDPAYGVK